MSDMSNTPVHAVRLNRRWDTRGLIRACCVVAAMLVASSPMARGNQPSPAEDPMAGPGIKDNAPPGRAFGEPGSSGADRMFAPRPPAHPLFMRAVRELGSPVAPEAVRLTPEQRDSIMEIEEGLREQQRAFREQHADEIRAIREKAGLPPDADRGGGERGARGGRRPEMDRRGERRDDPEFKESREKLRELMDKAPKPDDAQARQWALLNPAQQAHVIRRMNELRERLIERTEGERAGKGRGPGGEDRPRRGERGRPSPEAGLRDDAGPRGGDLGPRPRPGGDLDRPRPSRGEPRGMRRHTENPPPPPPAHREDDDEMSPAE